MKTTWRFVIAIFGALIIVLGVFAFMSLLYFKAESEPSDEEAEMYEDVVGGLGTDTFHSPADPQA